MGIVIEIVIKHFEKWIRHLNQEGSQYLELDLHAFTPALIEVKQQHAYRCTVALDIYLHVQYRYSTKAKL